MTDVLLVALLMVVAVGGALIERRLRELTDTLNALAEMLGEEIDRRRNHG